MKLISTRIKNFRGFIDTGHIKLRPINILVGKNSIGKSSYARLWPLFNQGIGLQKRSPVVWSGNQVDFGSFEDVLSRYSNGKVMSFEFVFEAEANSVPANLRRFMSRVRILNPMEIKTKVDMTLASDGFGTVCEKLTLFLNEKKVEYLFNGKGDYESISIGDKLSPIEKIYVTNTKIIFFFPIVEFFVNRDTEMVPAYSSARMKLWNYLRTELHGKIGDGRVHEIVENLNVVGSLDELIKYCFALPYEYKSWKDFLYKLSNNFKVSNDFYDLILMVSGSNLIRDLDTDLNKHYQGVSYIQPLRATAQRDYRKQELSVEKIDSRGENLPFFLESLTASKLRDLNSWLADTLEVKIQVKKASRHVSIVIEDLVNNRTDNITDMGFGYSQVLPLAVQAWISSSQVSGSKGVAIKNTILVWEQPELHLHPAMQRKLARLIARTTKLSEHNGIVFIVETHSQSIINELGDMIMNEELEDKNIQVLLFEQDKEKKAETTIKPTFYDSDGQLQDWPHGFLAV